jgi:hypothetical protein
MTELIYGRAYHIQGNWERRAETPEALAKRFLQTVDALRVIDPVFDLWTCGVNKPLKFENERDHFADEVAASIVTDDWGKPDPMNGYLFGALTRAYPRERSFTLSAWAGSTFPRPFRNSVTLDTGSGAIPDPSIVTYKIFKAALLAIVEAWEPLRCAAYPHTILNYVDKDSYFCESWIQYLCPWLAELIVPPPSAIVEHLPGGGLLMSATTETFDVANPAHMAAARDMSAAMAPLRAIPWEERAKV